MMTNLIQLFRLTLTLCVGLELGRYFKTFFPFQNMGLSIMPQLVVLKLACKLTHFAYLRPFAFTPLFINTILLISQHYHL